MNPPIAPLDPGDEERSVGVMEAENSINKNAHQFGNLENFASLLLKLNFTVKISFMLTG